MDAPTGAPAPAPVTPPVAGDQSGYATAAAKAAPAAKPDLKSAAGGTPPADKALAPTDAKDAKEVKAAIEKIKLKSGEYSAEEIESLIEKSKGADKKFLEAAKAKKEAIRFFKMARENPKEFLQKTGLDPKKFAYDEVAQDLKDKLRDPKEVELEQAQKRLQEYERKETEAKKKADNERLDREAKAIEQRFHAEMIDALEAFPQLPKNGFTVAALARAIDTVREKTGVLLTAKEVAPKVVNDIRSMVSGIVKGSSPEQLIELIGEEGYGRDQKARHFPPQESDGRKWTAPGS
jgi:hypothetical protein